MLVVVNDEATVLTSYIEHDGGTTRSMCFDIISQTMDEPRTEPLERDSRTVQIFIRNPVTFRNHYVLVISTEPTAILLRP
jgi:hypothetical protein